MNDNDSGVYVIMTSNDVSQLPPEFTRPGRIDCTWYFGLPCAEERRGIFKIHFQKKGRTVSDVILNAAVKASEAFTGAEIQQVVKNCMRHAYSRYLKDNNDNITKADVVAAAKEVIPISKSSREKIAALDIYCRDRARSTSDQAEKAVDNSSNDEFSLDLN